MFYPNSPQTSPQLTQIPYGQQYAMMQRQIQQPYHPFATTEPQARLYPYHYQGPIQQEQGGFITQQSTAASPQYVQMRVTPVDQSIMSGYPNQTANGSSSSSFNYNIHPQQQQQQQQQLRHHAMPVGSVPLQDDRYRKQLIVNYLAPDVTSTDLHELFSRFGELDGARIIYDKQTNMSKGYGFVYFCHAEDAKEAVERMSGYEFHGKWLKVGYSTNPLNIVPSNSSPYVHAGSRGAAG
ncbi:RNA-binding protein RBP6 [Trypanosoma brucei equiperdum]|uniref:RNA-binding protein RBP6 n=1 Tax=Trypanosoma brucei equiperdum TaxID=630700 RepID=A0A3L6LB01_9TRYP|nr:RNA-binding protein RBP6 [Trypanosoma brucei equiperdum]